MLAATAVQAAADALEALGHTAAPGSGAELVVAVDDLRLQVRVHGAAVITPAVAARLTAPSAGAPAGAACVAVGDLVSAAAKDVLRDAGWGWLDRRGQLVLRAPGLHIDAAVPPDPRLTDAPRAALSGRAAITWAAALLQSPHEPPAMRAVARRAGLSHSSIVAAAKRLREASLVRADGRPLIPELFWALAEQWRPAPVALATLPDLEDGPSIAELGIHLDGDGPGWALSGSLGAAAWGAPIAIGVDAPPDLYVPDAAVLRRAVRRLGPAERFEERSCTVAVAPCALVCAERLRRTTPSWPVAHPVFTALDLARDRTRGAEILDAWDPVEVPRAW